MCIQIPRSPKFSFGQSNDFYWYVRDICDTVQATALTIINAGLHTAKHSLQPASSDSSQGTSTRPTRWNPVSECFDAVRASFAPQTSCESILYSL